MVSLFVEQVRLHPPGHREGAELEGALADPEVQAQLEPGEPVLGYGPSGAVDNLTLLYAHRHLHEQARPPGRGVRRGRRARTRCCWWS